MMPIIVIIPTRGRPHELAKALDSVRRQTHHPNQLIVIHEEEDDVGVARNMDWPWPIVFSKNSRTSNLSGAVNHGVQDILIHRDEWDIDPESTYLALLDDDDWWDDEYLDNCIKKVDETDADLIVSGIRRYDPEHPKGWNLPIPKSLCIDDFLVGNPNIQGSNLFVRLSCFLHAGGFDEYLSSTTDRDFCIRLFESNDLKWATVDQHIVHHNAIAPGRISDRGGSRKAEGLKAFASKHALRMSSSQRRQFRDRCLKLFSIDPFVIKDSTDDQEHSQIIQQEGLEIEYQLTLAATIMSKARANSFLNEVDKFLEGFTRPWRLVVVLYQCSMDDFQTALKKYPALIEKTIIHRTEDFDKLADRGLLGPWFKKPERRIGIAVGRTILHRAVLEASINDERPVAWILDDDMQLTGLYIGIPPVQADWRTLDRYIHELYLKDIAIGIGSVIGDPAIPAINSLRVQLLDLNLYILSQSTLDKININHSPKDQTDWYYDLSTVRTDHLEWPAVHTLDTDPVSAAEKVLCDLRKGVVSLRRAVVSTSSHPWFDCSKMATRGGNTLILDTECLRLYPNISPIIKGNALRRSDTLWTVLNQRLGGRILDHEKKKVCYIPLHLPHNRRVYEEIKNPVNHLREDVLGSGITRALDIHCSQFSHFDQFSDNMNAEASNLIVNDGLKFCRQRNARLIENLYRVSGLLTALNKNSHKLSMIHEVDQDRLMNAITGFRDWIEPSISKVWLMKFDKSDELELTSFVRELPNYIEQFRIYQPYSAGLIRCLGEVGVNSKTTILDPALLSIFDNGEKNTILDYGCGKGEVAQVLAKKGHEVVGYDIDRKLISSLQSNGSKVRFIDPDQLNDLKMQGQAFQKIICSLVLCTIESDDELEQVVQDLSVFADNGADIVVAICNPNYIHVRETESHVKLDIPVSCNQKFIYRKKLKSLGTTRLDVYRPYSYYHSLFEKHGLTMQETFGTPATNLEDGTPVSDFMVIRLRTTNQKVIGDA